MDRGCDYIVGDARERVSVSSHHRHASEFFTCRKNFSTTRDRGEGDIYLRRGVHDVRATSHLRQASFLDTLSSTSYSPPRP
jgi:hypothetical protein